MGHGEYIKNVKKPAEFCKARGAKTKEEIEKILNEAEIEKNKQITKKNNKTIKRENFCLHHIIMCIWLRRIGVN